MLFSLYRERPLYYCSDDLSTQMEQQVGFNLSVFRRIFTADRTCVSCFLYYVPCFSPLSTGRPTDRPTDRPRLPPFSRGWGGRGADGRCSVGEGLRIRATGRIKYKTGMLLRNPSQSTMTPPGQEVGRLQPRRRRRRPCGVHSCGESGRVLPGTSALSVLGVSFASHVVVVAAAAAAFAAAAAMFPAAEGAAMGNSASGQQVRAIRQCEFC